MTHTNTSTNRTGRAARRMAALAFSCALVWAALPDSLRRVVVPGAAAANFAVTNTHDSGAGSLRAAILAANASAGKDTISFQLGPGPKSIKPLTPLPEITDPVVIDATTQPGFLGKPVVELDGSAAGKTVGLRISAGGSTVKGLVINRFAGAAVLLTGGGQNEVQGNYLGTDATGNTAAGNAHGVWIESGSGSNLVGGYSASERNVISGNDGDGVRVEASSPGNNKIRLNYIGTDRDGSEALPNGLAGVRLQAPGNTVGGEGTFTGDAHLQGNVISANPRGLVITGAAAKNNIVRGNTIGLDAEGKQALGNTVAGVEISAPDNKVGGSLATDGNTISGNDGDGLLLLGETCQNTLVQNNLIGPGDGGLFGVGNGGAGVRLSDAPNNTVGGLFDQTGNTIAFNKGAGVSVQGAKAAGNKIQGNRLGPLPGDAGAGNFGAGVEIVGAPNNTVGGTSEGQRNHIAGNSLYGVDIREGAAGNKVQGNYVGLFECLCAALGNGPAGVRIHASSNNTVGGAEDGARNYIISGQSGVTVEDGAAGNTVAGNHIGFGPGGKFLTAADKYGVRLLRSSNNTVGGTSPAARNVIGGFGLGGVNIEGPYASGNKVQGNYIGTTPNGAPGTLYQSDNHTNLNGGVYIFGAFDNLVGGDAPGAGNLIAGNGVAGVVVESGTGNAVLGNSIHSNGPREIDLWPIQTTPNDASDADRGANERQNHPVLRSASAFNLAVQIKGALDSAPNRQYRVEFFGNNKCGVHGQGGGEKFLGAAAVSTGADGHAEIDATVTAFGSGKYITATATDPEGNTSEFSPCLANAAPGVLQFSNFSFLTKESDGSVTVSVMRSAGAAGMVKVDYTTVDPAGGQQGEATPGADYKMTSGTLTFEEGEYLKSFQIPITADGQTQEGDEFINLKLSNPTGGAALGEYDYGIVTIRNTKLSNPAVVISDAVVGEGDSGTKQAALNVHVDPHTDPVVVFYSTKDGTAAAGEDYAAVGQGQLIFAPGEADKTILIDVHGDPKPEKDEVLFVAFELTGGYAFNEFGHQQRQIVIANDDAVPTAFAFEVSSLSTVENAGAATLNVTRLGPASGAASVDYSTKDGSAAAGADYAHASGTLGFAPGETSKAITVQLADDQTYEALEEFEVELSAPSAGAVLGAPSSAKIYVADEDSAPSLSVSDTSVFEGHAGTTDAVFAVTLSAPSGVEVSVAYATADLNAPEHAVAGEDYSPAQGQLTFAPGETSKQVVVKIKGDTAVEADEALALVLSNSDAATFAKKSGLCTIKNDDAPAEKPSASVSDASVAEGDSGTADAVFTVTLSAAGGQPLSFTYETLEMQALNAAQAGADYLHSSGSVTFAPGETSKTITVAVKGDAAFEPDEVFALSLGAPAGGGADVADGVALCVITNDDAAPTPEPTPKPAANTFQFEQAVYAAQEESSHITLTVTRGGDTSGEARVDYETIAGTADDRGEFTTALGTLRFAAGEDRKSFDLLLNEDSLPEAAQEEAQVVLSNPSAGFTLGQQAAATVKVSDDASEPTGNAIDDAELFVRQHYHDFLNREPDAAGLQFWKNDIESCGSDMGCREVKRVHVSAAFFLSIEFQQTGFLLHRLTRASYAAPPRYRDFVRDARALGEGVVVGQQGWEQRLEQNRQAFMEAWVARPEFKAKYDGMSNEQYVAALYQNLGLSPDPQESEALVSALVSTPESRGAVLLKVIDGLACRQQEQDDAFVLMQYFGYLRRNPDDAPDSGLDGYNYWLAKLNKFGGDFVKAEMVKAFISSDEYRSRFGQ